MKLAFKIIFTFFILAVAIWLIVYWFFSDSDKQSLHYSCSSIVNDSIKAGRYNGFGSSNDTKFIACYGVITEELWTESENAFSIYDHKNKYEVVRLEEQGHYKLQDDNLFIFVEENRPKDLLSYAVWYFVGGEEKLFTYKSYDDVPKYLSIDINSGEVTIYSNNLNEIPTAERQIFQELDNE